MFSIDSPIKQRSLCYYLTEFDVARILYKMFNSLTSL